MAQYSAVRKPPKLPFLNIGPEKSAQLSVLTELDGFTYAVEHSSPNAWYKSGICTYPHCYACDQKLREWNQKIKVYIPVMHRGEFKILASGMGVNSVIHPLKSYFVEHGTIRDTEFIISRIGAGKRTKYLALPVDNSTPQEYNGDISLSKMLQPMGYTQQAKYYN